MKENEHWSHLTTLDDQYLKGWGILSQWCSSIIRDADVAFVNGAHLVPILTSVSGIGTYLRSEYSVKSPPAKPETYLTELDKNFHRLKYAITNQNHCCSYITSSFNIYKSLNGSL
jgi:hypothetical protein